MRKEKVKLFRRGKLVGLVSKDFHFPQERKIEAFWEKLEIQPLEA